MLIVKFKQEYKHTSTRTWKAGDTPTLDREFAKRLVNELGVAEWVGDGCGCPGIDEDTIARHNTLATRGIEQDDDETLENLPDTTTKQDGVALKGQK